MRVWAKDRSWPAGDVEIHKDSWPADAGGGPHADPVGAVHFARHTRLWCARPWIGVYSETVKVPAGTTLSVVIQ